MSVAPHQPPGQGLCIRIDQQLVRIEPQAAFRIVAPVDAVAVSLPRLDLVQVPVPDVFAALGQCDAVELAAPLAVEQTELDFFSMTREQCEVGTPAIPSR